MSVMLAQINMMFEDKYSQRGAQTQTSIQDSTAKLSHNLMNIVYSELPDLIIRDISIYNVFEKKLATMSTIIQGIYAISGMQQCSECPWKRIFTKLVDESLGYSRDGTF